ALMATVIAPITAVAVPGDLYVSTFDPNTNTGVIVQITPGGTQSTFASAPGEQLNGVAFDKSSNLFVGANNVFVSSATILKYTPGGTQSTFATGLTEPRGLAFDSAGNLFEADKTSGNIYEFTPGGVRSTFATGLFQPIGLAFDGAGNLFEADTGSGNIFEFTP